MRKRLSANLAVLALLCSGCVSVPNTRIVSVSGSLSAGGIWSETQTDATGDLTFEEMLDLIDPQPERICVPVEGFNICKHDQSTGVKVTLPERGGAIIMSSQDFAKMHTALELACRALGRRCSYQIKQSLLKMKVMLP